MRAQELARAGCYDEAISLYRELMRSHPEDDSYHFALAWIYHDCGRKEEAVASFQELFEKELKRKVFSGFAFDELVRIYKKDGNLDLLVDTCERAVAVQKDDFALLGDLGDAYLRIGRWHDAIGIFERMIAMEPDSSAVFCCLGNAYAAEGELHKAREAYAKAVEIEPEREEIFLCRLAEAYLKAGHISAAEEILKACLAGRTNPLLYLDLADLLLGEGRIEEGRDLLEKAVNLGPESEGAFCNRFGNSLARAGHHELAIEYFQRAIRTDPGNPFYYMHLAASCTVIGREDIAAAMLSGTDLT